MSEIMPEDAIGTGGFGYIESPYDVRDYKLSYKAINPEAFPKSFDLGVIRVKNQGDKPTCAAHACSELVEYFNYHQKGDKQEFSTDFIYGIREPDYYYGDGMYLRDAIKTLQHYGDVIKSELPSNSDVDKAVEKVTERETELKEKAYPNRISSYYRIYSDDELKYALTHYGPVIIGMKWFLGATVSIADGYTFKYPQNLLASGHAVIIVGWTEDNRWIVQNSWGKTWAKGGRFYIDMANGLSGDNVIREAYGVTDNINDPDIKKPSKFVTFFSKIINFIANLFKSKK